MSIFLWQTMLLCLAVLLNATLVLACIFCPKIYAIYRVRNSDQHWSPNFRAVRGSSRFVRQHNDIQGVATNTECPPKVVCVTNTPPSGEKEEHTRGQCDGAYSAATSSESEGNQTTKESTVGAPEERSVHIRKLDARQPTVEQLWN